MYIVFNPQQETFMDQQQQAQQVAHMMLAIMPMIFLFGLSIFAFLVFLFWRIFAKAGMPGALSLIVLVPGIGWFICLCLLAFAAWKVAPIAPPAYLAYPPQYPPPPPPPAPTAQY
jgi:hypothetical protein